MTVLWSLLLRDNGQCVAMLEVEPREVLIRPQGSSVVAAAAEEQQDNERQQPGEQPTGSANISSAVVKEALFSCLEVLI